MTVEKDKATRNTLPRALSVTLVLVFVIAAALLLAILLWDKESPAVTSNSGVETGTAVPVAPEQIQAFSPQALEDLRPAPTGDMEINPEPLLLEPLPEENAGVTGDDAPIPETPEGDTQDPIEEPFSVGEALARYLLAIRNELNSEYVANCIRFRNRNGAGAGCPQDPAYNASTYQQEQALVDELFSVITREGEYARLSRQLERENETLADILDDPDNPATLQASMKLTLNKAYLAYLNGNPNPDVATFNTMNDFINDYNRTIIAGPTQFRCQQGPCVYEYTPPETE